jgi:hypothetical protein
MADNEQKTLDYVAFLADLEAKRAALDQAIASLRAVMAGGALANVGATVPLSDLSAGIHGGDVPVGAFLGKSIPEAAKLCLQIIKKKLTSREIAEALKKGGIETISKNFSLIVHSILMRSARSGASGIVKLDRSHWGLAEWYPSSMRTSVPLNQTKSKKRQNPKPKAPKSKADTPKQSEAETIPEKIWEVLNKPGAELSAQEIADKVGTKSNVAAMLLGQLIRQESAEKTANGKYRAIKTAA